MGTYLGTDVVCQLGMVVHDIKETGQAFADFFGVDTPPIVDSGEDEVVKAEYKGEPSTAKCKMMFFEAGNIQIELIQPDDQPSVWRDILDEKGEGLHHIAFEIKNSEEKIKTLESQGYHVMQKGFYGDGTGMYIYIDARDQMKLILELLESF